MDKFVIPSWLLALALASLVVLIGVSYFEDRSFQIWDHNFGFGPVAVPKGLLVLYGKGTCPPGWKNVPDAADKYIVAAGQNRLAGQSGGLDTITLSPDQLPAHSHMLQVSETGELNLIAKGGYPGHRFVGRGQDKQQVSPAAIRYTEDGGKGTHIEIAPEFYAVTLCEKL